MTSRRGKNHRYLLVGATVLMTLAGCTSAGLRPIVGKFSTLTSEAVTAQKAELAVYGAADADRVSRALAADRIVFNFSPECMSSTAAAQCHLLGPGNRPVETAFLGENLLALGEALDAYAKSLGNLAADSSSDVDAFTQQIAGAAVSVGGLNNAVAKFAGGTAVPTSNLTAIGDILSTVGGLYFETARAAALRRIIIESDPIVQKAAGLLAATSVRLASSSLIRRQNALVAAQGAHEAAIDSGAAEAVVRARQDELFKAVNQVRQPARTGAGFVKLGEVHSDLARAARAGASISDLIPVMERLAEAATVIRGATQKLGATP